MPFDTATTHRSSRLAHGALAAVVLCLSAVLAPVSHAADPAIVETLMRDTGLWKTLGDLEPGIQSNLRQSVAEAPKKPERAEVQRLERLIAASFDPDRLRGIARAHIAANLDDEHVPVLQAWVASADGKLITKLESNFPKDHAATEKAKRDGITELEKMKESRRELIEDLLIAQRATELTVDVAVQSMMIALEAIRRARPDIPVPSEHQVRARLQAGRAHAERQMKAAFLEVYASVYKKLTDEQIRAYEEWLTGKAGRHLVEVFNDGVQAAIANGTELLWKDLIPAAKPAPDAVAS